MRFICIWKRKEKLNRVFYYYSD